MDNSSIVKTLQVENMSHDEQMALLDSIQQSIKNSKVKQKERANSNAQLVVQALKKIKQEVETRFDELNQNLEEKGKQIVKGAQGVAGRDGKDGKDGKQGINGLNGRDGKDGKDGQDGQDGVSVTDAKIDFDGSLVITLSTGQELNVGEVVPPDIAEKIRVVTTMSSNASVGIKDEGSSISTGVKTINFVGATVTATNSGDDVTVNVSAGTGDVAGPASSTDNAITRFDSTTGKLIQNSLVTVADDGAITAPQVGSVIPFYYANQAAFPSASTYHGAVAHSHADGAMYFAHGGNWIKLLDVASPVAINQGGTGQTTASSAFNALSPITTTGDLIIGNGANSATRLPIGSNTYVLTSNGTTATWSPASTGGSVTSVAASVPSFLSITGSPITTSGTLAISLASTPTNGQLLIGNGTGFSYANLTAGSNVTITNSSGGITIASTGSGGGGASLDDVIALSIALGG